MALDFDGGDEDNIVYGNYVTMHGNGGKDQLGSNATVFTQIYGGADNDGVYYYGPSTSALYGDAGDDSIYGGSLGDKIFGGGGDDWMFGGLGKDIFKSGGGADHIGFNSVPNSDTNRDVIKDFNPKKDILNFVPSIYTVGVSGATLLKSQFQKGAGPNDADDFFGYDKKTGIVWYDPNGDQDGGFVEVAKLSKDLHLTYHQFQF